MDPLDKNNEMYLNISSEEYEDILSSAGFGVWHIILKEGNKPRMQVNEKMAQLLGIYMQNLSQEEIYESWYGNILQSEVSSVQASVKEMIDGKFSENTYKWHHPTKGIIYVRCGGTAIKLADGTNLLRGYHADVTPIVEEEERKKKALQEAMGDISQAYSMVKAFSHEYHTIWSVDKDTYQMRFINSSGKSVIPNAVQIGLDNPDFDTAFSKYIDNYVETVDKSRLRRELKIKNILKHLEKEDSYAINYLRKDENDFVGYHQMLFANADTDDGKRQFVFGFRNITDLVKAEQDKQKELEDAKFLAESRNKELMKQLEIFNSLSKAYNCIYYIDMSDYSFVQLGLNLDGVKEIIGEKGNAVESFDKMCEFLVYPEMAQEMKKFTNLETLNKRLKNCQWIANEFRGPVGGWSEGIFIAANRDNDGNCEHVIWATRNIEEIKEKEARLLYTSNTDELTGLLNRRAYEEAIKELNRKGLPENFVYVSIDINGLKAVNDGIGHEAGDELIIGACKCMKKALAPHGNIYRTGGDEFIALITADEDQLIKIQKTIEKETSKWSGKLVDSVSLACGFVTRSEMNDSSLHEIVVLADQRMYDSKTKYYRKKGINRRGQLDAHAALCELYTKILKINLTEDSYEILNMDGLEQNQDLGFSEKLSEWFKKFAESGQVMDEDKEEFCTKSNLDYLKEHFKAGNKIFSIIYRRRYMDSYKSSLMEIIPANDYTDEDQSLFLYVKNIDK